VVGPSSLNHESEEESGVRVLVTGGSGYIGSHAVRALTDGGHHVVVIDLRPMPLAAGLDQVTAVTADIRDTPLLIDLLQGEGIDGVVHFAGLRSVAESMRDPGTYFDTNVLGSISVMRAMAEAGSSVLVFSSSCSVYGNPARIPADEALPFAPESPYAASKVAVERILPWFAQRYGLRAVSLRYFNAAGASFDASLGEDWDRSPMLIPNLIKAALGSRGPLDIYGADYPTPDGSAIRDYIHVVDLADAHVRALDVLSSDAPGTSRAMNLGTGIGWSVRQVIRLVEEVGGRPVPLNWTDRRPGDPAQVWADPSLAFTTLGWRARHDLRAMIESAWVWHSRVSPTDTVPG
jgi:UDP-glucose 4-epimerase